MCNSHCGADMLQTEVLRPWLRLSFETFRLGLEVQRSVIGLLNHSKALTKPMVRAPEVPTALESALAGTPYAAEVVRAVADEIASGSQAVKPHVARAKSQRATKGTAHQPRKPGAKKVSARKLPRRRKG
jgi:hypothetical protein